MEHLDPLPHQPLVSQSPSLVLTLSLHQACLARPVPMRAYVPWAQVKEQEAAKAKPEEQEKGIKAKELKPKVPRIPKQPPLLSPSPGPIRTLSFRPEA